MSKKRKALHPASDAEREERIEMEAIVDAYGPDERAMGWYYYLQNKMTFPFRTVCDVERETSPLNDGEKVEVLGLADEEACLHEICARIKYPGKKGFLAVPLMQLAANDDMDDDTQEALEDWRYWMNMGYDF